MYKQSLKRRSAMMESVETVCQNIIWVLPYYISRFVHKDPHALEFSSWGGGWKVFQFPCPCFYPHYMYICSFQSHNTGHKPFYRRCFQLIDLLHMNRTLNINPHIFSPLREKKTAKHVLWVRHYFRLSKDGNERNRHKPSRNSNQIRWTINPVIKCQEVVLCGVSCECWSRKETLAR